MVRTYQVAILSDIHYAGALEQTRGNDYEFRDLKNPCARLFIRYYRRYVWVRDPFRQNHLLDEFIRRVGTPDLVVANGDYSCDTAFIGVSDDASLASAQECLGKLRDKFAPRFEATFGDHELGKLSFFGDWGGMRLASWLRAKKDLSLKPLWRAELGNYVLLGVTSTLLALPVFENDMLPEECTRWEQLREEHFADVRREFAALKSGQRVLLFCHDPSALPFLWHDETVRKALPQIEQTVIGHLHSPLVFWKSRLLAGMPPIRFLGHTVKRLSTTLSAGRHWRPFNVRLCPSLAGIELKKTGGFYTVELDADARQPARFQLHRIKR